MAVSKVDGNRPCLFAIGDGKIIFMTYQTTSAKNLAKLTKAELICMLADDVVSQNRALYAGHYKDALTFVRNHLGPTRRSLLLSAQVRGLVPFQAD